MTTTEIKFSEMCNKKQKFLIFFFSHKYQNIYLGKPPIRKVLKISHSCESLLLFFLKTSLNVEFKFIISHLRMSKR